MRQKNYIKSKSLRWSAIAAFLVILLFIFQGAPLFISAHSGNNTVLLTIRNPSNQPFRPPFHSQFSLAKGRFLVAGREMKDPRFAETVILLIDYSSQGAVGLIINRPTEVKLSAALPHTEGLKNLKDIFYFGGPVNPSQMTMLIRSGHKHEEAVQVFSEIYYSRSLSVLQWLLQNPGKENQFHIYIGYAGWAPRQLDSEVLRGDWHILRADAESIFTKDHAQLWQELINRVISQWVNKNVFETVAGNKGQCLFVLN